MTNPDQLLAELRGALDYAPKIFDLKLRATWYRLARDRANYAIVLDVLTTEQRDALTVLREQAIAGIDETALALPPVPPPLGLT